MDKLTIRVLVAEDHPLVREGVIRALSHDEMTTRVKVRTDGRIAIPILGEIEARGIPRELQYAIRDAGGTELPTRMILLKETRFVPGMERDMWGGRTPPDAFLHGSFWMVFASLAGYDAS